MYVGTQQCHDVIRIAYAFNCCPYHKQIEYNRFALHAIFRIDHNEQDEIASGHLHHGKEYGAFGVAKQWMHHLQILQQLTKFHHIAHEYVGEGNGSLGSIAVIGDAKHNQHVQIANEHAKIVENQINRLWIHWNGRGH